MKPFAAIGLALATAMSASAHFVWIGSSVKDGKTIVTAGFGEVGEYESKYAGNIKQAKYWSEDASGKTTPISMTLDERLGEYRAEVSGKPSVIFGSCDYGIFQRGEGPAGHLMYTAKRVVEASPAFKDDKPRKDLRIEILAAFAGDKATLTVIHHGKPVEGAEVKHFGPNDKAGTVKTDAKGVAVWKLDAPGEYSCYVGVNKEKSGEHNGKKFQTERDYATLTFTRSGSPAAAVSQLLPALPEGFSSFGAAVSDGYVYVYGGHKGVTHNYSTKTVHGKFRRLNLASPSAWEELPEGPIAQGLALVAHKGILYRIGGMAPKNNPDGKADNVSLDACAAFDPKTNKWTDVAPLPKPRSSFDAVTVGDKIYLFGGWTMKGKGQSPEWAETGLVLDLSQKSPTWKEIPQPFQRRALNIAEANGKIYVVAGLTPDDETEAVVDVFNTADGTWAKTAPLPGNQRNQFSPAVCAFEKTIIASPSDGVVYRLNEAKNEWEKIGAVQHKRIVHRIVPTPERKLAVLGGATKGANVAEVELVEPKG